MPKKVDHQQRRDHLAKACHRVIMQRGFAAATLREVAREAKMSSPLLVHYIKTREELLLHAHAYAAHILRNRFLRIEQDYKGLEAFRRILWGTIPHDKPSTDNFKLWLGFWEMAERSPHVKAKLTSLYQETSDRFERILQQAKELGEISNDLDLAVTAWTATTFVDGIGAQVLATNQKFPKERLKKYLNHWIEQNLRPKPGKKPKQIRRKK